MAISGVTDYTNAYAADRAKGSSPLNGDSQAYLNSLKEKYPDVNITIQTWTTDPITWYCWPDEQGVPMLSVGIVRDMPHANYPEESWISYDQFFSGFYRNEKSQLCWRGKIIESIQDTGKA